MINASSTLLLSLLLLVSFASTGCEKRVEVIVNVHDTTIVRDTVSPPGPAFVRFVRLNAKPTQGSIYLYENFAGGQILTNVNTTLSKEYFHLASDTTLVFRTSFTHASGQSDDSVLIPPLRSYSLTTIVLYQQIDNGIILTTVDDSARLSRAPAGFAYVRFINGLSDYPQPEPVVSVYLDTATTPILARPVSFGEAHSYVLVPTGLHTLSVRAPGSSTSFRQAQQNFVQGGYYTAKLTGMFGSDELTIGPE